MLPHDDWTIPINFKKDIQIKEIEEHYLKISHIIDVT